ncbi:MAG: hypothetical protein AB8F78_01970 [Saprospiraceae bacterium]
MKIISKYKDFYDDVQALGIDKTLTYRRFQNTCAVENLSGFIEFNESVWKNLPEPYRILPTGESHHTSNELIIIEYSSIGFCGKLYPYIRSVKQINNTVLSSSTFYNGKEAHEFTLKLQIKFPKLEFMNEFDRCKKPTEQELNKYIDTSSFKKERTEWFQEVNSPIFIFNEDPYKKDIKSDPHKITNKSSLGFILTNPILREFEFYKIMDNYTCHQALSQYLGGVLTDRETLKDNLTDLQKVRQHGFNKKYGFRTRPKNKMDSKNRR